MGFFATANELNETLQLNSMKHCFHASRNAAESQKKHYKYVTPTWIFLVAQAALVLRKKIVPLLFVAN